jgi:hypothetical protein
MGSVQATQAAQAAQAAQIASITNTLSFSDKHTIRPTPVVELSNEKLPGWVDCSSDGIQGTVFGRAEFDVDEGYLSLPSVSLDELD